MEVRHKRPRVFSAALRCTSITAKCKRPKSSATRFRPRSTVFAPKIPGRPSEFSNSSARCGFCRPAWESTRANNNRTVLSCPAGLLAKLVIDRLASLKAFLQAMPELDVLLAQLPAQANVASPILRQAIAQSSLQVLNARAGLLHLLERGL